MRAIGIRACLAGLSIVGLASSQSNAADVEIVNRSGMRMSVYMWCQSHNGWSDMAGNNQKGVSLVANRKTSADQHPGRYRIVAMTADRDQFSQWVTIKEGKVNKFRIDALYGAPPNSSPSSLFHISEDNRDDDADLQVDDDGLKPTTRTVPTPAKPRGTYAANLGIYYEAVTYADGTFGAKLTADPKPGSPAAGLRLEPGDTIYELDGQRFRTAADVLNHRYRTSMLFINVRTNAPQAAAVVLP